MIAGLAVALSAAGSIAGIVGSVMQYKGAKKAEKLRQRQMQLEANRARREQIRQAQVSRAKATAAAWNSGAEASSALVGGQSQAATTAARNAQAISQDESFGNRIFKANAQVAKGGMVSALGQGISSLGGAVSGMSGTITSLGGSTGQGSGFQLPFMKKQTA